MVRLTWSGNIVDEEILGPLILLLLHHHCCVVVVVGTTGQGQLSIKDARQSSEGYPTKVDLSVEVRVIGTGW